MAEEVARLVAVMEAQLRGFTKGMEQAQAEADRRFGQIERRMNQTERKFQNSFKDLGSLATRVGGALGVAFSVEGLINFGKQVVTSVAQLSEQAQQLQVGVEAMQAYRIAFKESGSSAETADRAIGLLNKTLGEAQEGSKSARQQFAQLGLSFSELSRVSPDERLAVVAKALLSISDGSKRAALETQFFGRTGREIESVLARLATGAHSLTEEYKEQGRIIDAELAKKTDDAMDRIAAAFDRGKAATAPFFASIAEGIANALGELAGLPPTIDALTDQLKEAQKLANNLKNPGMLGRLWSDVTHLPDRAKGADALVEQIAGEIVRRAPTPEITPGLFKGAATGTGPAALGDLDKFFAKMQLIAELAGELPAEREKDQKLIEAATAKLEEEGRANLVLLNSMAKVNEVLNEQVGLREKILKIIEDENAATARAAFQERLNTARFNAGVTAGPTIPGGVIGQPTPLEQRLGTNVLPPVTITPPVGTFQPTVRPIPALDEAAKEHTDKLVQDRLNALDETQKKQEKIATAEQDIVFELSEEARIAGLLPREREEEIELLRIRQRFGDEFVRQHEEEFRGLIKSRQAAEDYVAIQERAIDGLAEIGASALTGAKDTKQAFADLLKSLAQYIIKLELAKALEGTLGSPGGGGGFLGKAFDFLGSAIFGPATAPLLGPEIPSGVVITPRVRAAGGPVSKDEPYIVGEQGRELFVPETPGVIFPNKKTEEILKAKEGRAAGGPVSAGHSYTVGESGRELFVPSISGIIYPKLPDTNEPDREHGKQVIAGQPIVVGEQGYEVFIPDVSADVSVTVRHPSTNTEEIAVAQNAPVTPPAPAQQSAAVADRRGRDALKKPDATTSSKATSEAHHTFSEKRGTEIFARDSSEHTHQSDRDILSREQSTVAKSSEHDTRSARETIRDVLSHIHSEKSTAERDTQALIRSAASHEFRTTSDIARETHSETAKSENNTVIRSARDALRASSSKSVLQSHLAQTRETAEFGSQSRQIVSERLQTEIAKATESNNVSGVLESASSLVSSTEHARDVSHDVAERIYSGIEKAATNTVSVSTSEAARDTVSRESDTERLETAEPKWLEKSHPVGQLGRELFIPNVPGFIYSKMPSAKSKTGTRDIVKVLSAGQPIIVGGGRGQEVFVPYFSDDIDIDVDAATPRGIDDHTRPGTSQIGERSQKLGRERWPEAQIVRRDAHEFSKETEAQKQAIKETLQLKLQTISRNQQSIDRNSQTYADYEKKRVSLIQQAEATIADIEHRTIVRADPAKQIDTQKEAVAASLRFQLKALDQAQATVSKNSQAYADYETRRIIATKRAEDAISMLMERSVMRRSDISKASEIEKRTILEQSESRLKTPDDILLNVAPVGLDANDAIQAAGIGADDIKQRVIETETRKAQETIAALEQRRVAHFDFNHVIESEKKAITDALQLRLETLHKSEAVRDNSTQAFTDYERERVSITREAENLITAIESRRTIHAAAHAPSKIYTQPGAQRASNTDDIHVGIAIGEPSIRSVRQGQAQSPQVTQQSIDISAGMERVASAPALPGTIYSIAAAESADAAAPATISRASGGPVSPGYFYTVGEHGRELFTPSMSGKVSVQSFALGGILGGLLGGFGGKQQSLDVLMHHFAAGGIMGPHGQIPLKSYQYGGIANSPQVALFGEGSGPEAFIPLQGGKVPVRLQIPQMATPSHAKNGSGDNSIYIDARGAQKGVAEEIQDALTKAFPVFHSATVKTVERSFPTMYRRAARDKL